jgi:proton glutamate symport protein
MGRALFIIAALVVGILTGMAVKEQLPFLAQAANVIGTLWLNAMRMTVVPLVVALLVTGILQTATAAGAGRLATCATLTMIGILWLVTIMSALVTPLLLSLFPMPGAAAASLKEALGSMPPPAAPPAFSEILMRIVPTNPIGAAVNNDSILPLIVFTIAFAFATAALPSEKRAIIAGFFEAIAQAMIVLIGWVLKLAPLGVFALGITLGKTAGVSAFGALAHYVLIVTAIGTIIMLSAYPLAVFGGRFKLSHFFSTILPAQAVAISTQSSLGTLPTMLTGVRQLGVRDQTAEVTLPLAVAIFRATSPAMNLAVAIYVANWMGVSISPLQMATGVTVAAVTTLGTISLPGTISFISSTAPICLAMGIPIEPLAILIAIETFPDIMRTLGNVTMDMAVTGTIDRFEGGEVGS